MLKNDKKYNAKHRLRILIMSFGILLFNSAHAAPATGNGELVVTGRILEQPCITINDNPIIVDFGTITNKDIFKYSSMRQQFVIALNCDIGANGSVRVQFNSSNVSENNQLLNVSPQSQASGIGIKIEDESGNILTFGQRTVSVPISAGPNNIKFYSYVIKKSSTLQLSDIALGTFEASATFQIIYE